MTRTEKLFEFNKALCIFGNMIKERNKMKKLERETIQSEFIKAEIEHLKKQVEEKESTVKEILVRILGDEKWLSVVKLDYDDIHVVEEFQNYMNLI